MRRMSKRVMGPTIAAVLVLVGGTWADIGATGGDTTVPDGSTGATNADGETRTLGVSVLNRRQEIFINQLEVAEEWAAENGYELLIGDPDNDPLVQSDLLQGWLDSDQVDGIYVGPIDVAALEPVLEQADEEGIPVALSGFDEPQNDSQIMLVTDWIQFGRNAGQALADCINERFDGDADIVILDGPNIPGDIVTGRIDGIKEVLADQAPDSEVVAQQNGEGQRLISIDVMAPLLLQNPDIEAVTGTNDDSMIGVVGAFEEAGIDPSERCIVGLDATEEGLALVESGDFYATVDLQPNRNILEGLGALDAALDGEGAQSAEDRTIVLETRIVTEDDLPLES